MGQHDRTPVVWGAMMARDEQDRACGYQAYRIERATGERTFHGPVRETYQEAAQDARDAADAEGPVVPLASSPPSRVATIDAVSASRDD